MEANSPTTTDRVAIVTGGSGGIGRTVRERLPPTGRAWWFTTLVEPGWQRSVARSTKRVAAAVGEGSSAIASIHRAITTRIQTDTAPLASPVTL